MANLAKIPPRRLNFFMSPTSKNRLGTRKQYFALAKKWLNNPENWINGRRSLKGFTKAHGYLRLKDDSNVLNTFGIGINKKGNLHVIDKGKQDITAARAQQSRSLAIREQTSPNVEHFNWNTKPKEMHAHHRRMLKLYSPFYKGLNDKEKKELTQWFVDEGMPLGDAKGNLTLMTEKDHTGLGESIHNWMIENNIQVRAGKPGESNFIRGKDGEIKYVRGGADIHGDKVVLGSARMPDLSHLTLNERLGAAAVYLNYIQDPVEKKIDTYGHDRKGFNPDDVSTLADTQQTPTTKQRNRIPKTRSIIPGIDPNLLSIDNEKLQALSNLSAGALDMITESMPNVKAIKEGARLAEAVSNFADDPWHAAGVALSNLPLVETTYQQVYKPIEGSRGRWRTR